MSERGVQGAEPAVGGVGRSNDGSLFTRRPPRARWLLAVLPLALLAAHAAFYMPFLSDDALISLRYAGRLLDGQGLTWTDGRPVEGYSNLMWILLISLLGSAGLDLIAAARLLGLLCTGLVIACAAGWYLAPARWRAGTVAFLVGTLFFAGVAPTAAWAIGGLEQPLVAAALASAVPLFWAAAETQFSRRRLALALSVPLAVLCLTRPDGPLFTAGILLSALLCDAAAGRRPSTPFLAAVGAMPALAYGGQLVFRLLYYGEWVPNTALVKLTPSVHHLLGGLVYAGRGLWALFPASGLAVALVAAGIARPASRERYIPIAVLLAAWLGYVTAIGGDVFPAYRHFVPVVVLMTYALCEALATAGTRPRRPVLLATALGLVAITVLRQPADAGNRRAIEERWEWKGRSLAWTLRDAFASQRPTLAVTAAGCLPYWSGLPCLDMLGLNDYYLPRNKPRDIGRGYLGHELGDADYVLSQSPDIIVFNIGTAPDFRPGEELVSRPDFHSRYALMRVRTAYPPAFTAQVWFHRESNRIGCLRKGARLTIPAWFFNADSNTVARLDGRRLVVDVDAERPAGTVVPGLAAPHRIAVLSPRPQAIFCRAEPGETGTRITLSTRSVEPVPVGGVVLTVSHP